ncbi:MAG: Gfo/Idh/MocA family oxidoreductase [Planctomycetes bacterium]|nr:Gfo/Idh/MocA family oxidoreductase [Planctomycetota bacterium]
MTTSRRTFLGGAAAMAGISALPACEVSAAVRPRRKPGEKMRLLVIGVGGRGRANLNGVKGEDIRVLCDVDSVHLAAAAKDFPAARTIADHRLILCDREACAELDGVVISTPDHSHYLPAMLALKQRLDVYCEKPLTHTVAQARRLMTTAALQGCVTQMGIQIHANENFRRVVEAVAAGAVGAVREVYVFVNGTDWSAKELPPEIEVPERLDYDLWLGPVASRPFREGYHPAAWRRYWAFGGGTTADMGCHYTDLAFWALGLTAPVALVADGDEPHAECAPRGMRCSYEFAARGQQPALSLHWHAGSDRPQAALAERGLEKWTNGVLFIGDDGWLISNYDKHEVGPAARAAAWTAPAKSIAASPGHYKEWIDCCRDRTQPSCSFAYGAPLTEHVLLATAAFRAAKGRRLMWDAAAMKFDDEAATALLEEPARKGFTA